MSKTTTLYGRRIDLNESPAQSETTSSTLRNGLMVPNDDLARGRERQLETAANLPKPSEQESRQQSDADGFEDLVPAGGAETGWKNRDANGNPVHHGPEDSLYVDKGKRFWQLQHDRPYSYNKRLKYNTSRSDSNREYRKQRFRVSVTYNLFTLPEYVTEDRIQDRVKTLPSPDSTLGPYGGYKLLAVVAIVEELGLSDEELLAVAQDRELDNHDHFRQTVRGPFLNEVQTDSVPKVIRQIAKIRRRVGQ